MEPELQLPEAVGVGHVVSDLPHPVKDLGHGGGSFRSQANRGQARCGWLEYLPRLHHLGRLSSAAKVQIVRTEVRGAELATKLPSLARVRMTLVNCSANIASRVTGRLTSLCRQSSRSDGSTSPTPLPRLDGVAYLRRHLEEGRLTRDGGKATHIAAVLHDQSSLST